MNYKQLQHWLWVNKEGTLAGAVIGAISHYIPYLNWPVNYIFGLFKYSPASPTPSVLAGLIIGAIVGAIIDMLYKKNK